jgi:hypothetical protein
MKANTLPNPSLPYIDRQGLASALGVHPATIDRLRKRGIIPYLKLTRKLVLFDLAAVKVSLDRFAINAGRN